MAERVRSKWFLVRVTILLAVLVVVALYAWRDAMRRKERTQWNRTLDVALVVVRDGAVSDSAVGALRSSMRDLEAVLGPSRTGRSRSKSRCLRVPKTSRGRP
jgi:hypothetical protein